MEEIQVPEVSGPFGSYPANSVGGILNTLVRYYHVPLTLAEDVMFGSDNAITCRGETVGTWKYFDGMSIPLVRFTGSWRDRYGKNNFVSIEGSDKKKVDIRVVLTNKDTPGIVIEDDMATPQMHRYLMYPMLSNFMKDETYELKSNCAAFFQGGSHDPKGKWFFIEFWGPKGAEAWVKYINDNYEHDPNWKDPFAVEEE